jgi:hypothetical protein
MSGRSRSPRRSSRLSLQSLEQRDVPAAAFTVAVIPDTQFYSERYPATFNTQMNWVRDHLASENIVFVAGQGDIVQNGENGSDKNATEWARADAAYDILDGNLSANPDGLVPYAVPIGNHDYGRVNTPAAGASRYLEYFGPQRHAGRSWFGGASPGGLDQFQFFNGGGRQFLHLSMQWEVPACRR